MIDRKLLIQWKEIKILQGFHILTDVTEPFSSPTIYTLARLQRLMSCIHFQRDYVILKNSVFGGQLKCVQLHVSSSLIISYRLLVIEPVLWNNITASSV